MSFDFVVNFAQGNDFDEFTYRVNEYIKDYITAFNNRESTEIVLELFDDYLSRWIYSNAEDTPNLSFYLENLHTDYPELNNMFREHLTFINGSSDR